MVVLEKGLTYNTYPRTNQGEDKKNLMNIENAILKTDKAIQQEIRTLILDEIDSKKYNNNIQQTLNHNAEYKTILNIKKKINENNAVVTKADKGNTTVIMNKDEYDQKIDRYISNNNIKKLNEDPTPGYHKEINKTINTPVNIFTKAEIRYCKIIKPAAPKIRGLPKIHKEDTPIRPLINFTTAPAYRAAKKVNNLLTKHIKITEDYSIKNNLELINKIQTIDIPNNAKMASFDVTNMYSNIPVEDTIRITRELLENTNLEGTKINEIINMLKTITKQNYFTHRNEFYIQHEGLPMGSPLSGTLANIYLNHMEREHILNCKNKFESNIVYWYRYVDDIILLFTGTNRQIHKLQEYINKIHRNIKFTLELETNKTINFLDLTITNNNSKHEFKIYRKPTMTDQTIHKTSNHPEQHKYSAYSHMINRLNSIPMSHTNYVNEIEVIKLIAIKNGYNPGMIDRMNRRYTMKKINKEYTTLNDEKEKPTKYITTEYNNKTHMHVKKVLKKYGYTTAAKTNNKLEQKINKRESEEIDTGVYRLTCNDCEHFYIGQTGRSFKTRFNEHIKEINKDNIKSNYAQHITTLKHTFTGYDDNLQIIHKCKKGPYMDRLEEFEIYRNKENVKLMNDRVNTKTNNIYERIIRNERKRDATS